MCDKFFRTKQNRINPKIKKNQIETKQNKMQIRFRKKKKLKTKWYANFFFLRREGRLTK